MAHSIISLLSNNTAAIRGIADSGKPSARRSYGLTAYSSNGNPTYCSASAAWAVVDACR
jgi:hypothetical protein